MPRAGCVPFRKKNGTREFLKVKGLNRGWVFPAGRVKTGETKRQAAKREAFEEAGVRGKINYHIVYIIFFINVKYNIYRA